METEPKPASPSAPIMDVTPPAADEPSLAKPPQEAESAEVPAADSTAPPPKPVKTLTVPTVVVTLAVLCFLILSGLAYYAYTKAQ